METKIKDIRTNLNNTIDLASQYENVKYNWLVDNGYLPEPQSKKGAIIIAVITFICIIGIMITHGTVNASTDDIYSEHGRFINRFPLEKTVVGCYNDRTKEVRQDRICTKGGDHNVKLPARSQIVIWLKYYSEHQILNRLALVNFESDFNIHASNDRARGYVQTLKSHGVAIDIDSQLAWLKNRENKTYGKKYFNGKYGLIRGCAYYWDNYNYKDGVEKGEDAVLTCMYRYHYDANKGSWYGKRGLKATKFYKEYLFGITN